MQSFIETILTRRSIRKYTGEEIGQETIETLLKCGMYAPSAVNKQPWHFIVFEEKEYFNKIMEVHPNSRMLAGAKKAILVCGDYRLAHAPGYLPLDCAAATQNILLAAHSLGLGACWIGIHPREERIKCLNELFHLPEHIQAFSLISLGYPAEEKKTPERFQRDRIHYGGW